MNGFVKQIDFSDCNGELEAGTCTVLLVTIC